MKTEIWRFENNATERAIRGVAVGRNNWVFFGSDQGATQQRCCEALWLLANELEIDLFRWLEDVLSPITRLAELCRTSGRPLKVKSKPYGKTSRSLAESATHEASSIRIAAGR